jgi:NADPH:quinone reductase-like Zn-dependent oxidoreductase
LSTDGFPIALPPDPLRFSPDADRPEMNAVVTKAGGGYDQLGYRSVPVPAVLPGTVLIRVLAAGVNNTEVNTRLGWYSSSVDRGTNDNSDAQPDAAPQDGGWSDPTPFPFIQGTDCCGEVVEVGTDVGITAPGRRAAVVGDRVMVRPCMRTRGFEREDTVWMGSDFDGAFADYLLAPAATSSPSTATGAIRNSGASPAPGAPPRTCSTAPAYGPERRS